MVLICIGDRQSFDNYQQSFINEHQIETYNVVRYDQDLPISIVRQITHSLSFVQTNRLFVITGAMRVDSQNALLKALEELQQGVHFLFWSEKEDAFLETMKSRSKIVRLAGHDHAENNLTALLKSKSLSNWEHVDKIIQYVDEHGTNDLLPALREQFVEAVNAPGVDVHFRYAVCKKMLAALPLMENNNINSRVLIERVFECETTS